METYSNIRDGKIVPGTNKDAKIRVFAAPSEDEKLKILETLGINHYDLEAALDPDEIARVEFAPEHISIIWKQPNKRIFDQQPHFEVFSVGLLLKQTVLTMIVKENQVPFPEERLEGVKSLKDFMLKYFFLTVRKYLNHLKAIKQTTMELQTMLSASMDNKHFLRMFNISESLVYYLDAIEANSAVLKKLRDNAKKLKFSIKEIEFLDDIIQENEQCARQAQIYSTVLSGLMDARGNIINNNMNVLLRNLTIINVIFLPLNLFASMGGMSELTMIIGEYNISWQAGYSLFSVAMVLIGWLTWVVLRRYMGMINGQKNH